MAGLDGFIGRGDDADVEAVSVELDLTVAGPNGRPPVIDFLPTLLSRHDALVGNGSRIRVVKGPEDGVVIVSARGVTRDELSAALRDLKLAIVDRRPD